MLLTNKDELDESESGDPHILKIALKLVLKIALKLVLYIDIKLVLYIVLKLVL